MKKASTNPVTVTIIYLASAFYNLCKNKLIEETTFILKKLLVLKYATSWEECSLPLFAFLFLHFFPGTMALPEI